MLQILNLMRVIKSFGGSIKFVCQGEGGPLHFCPLSNNVEIIEQSLKKFNKGRRQEEAGGGGRGGGTVRRSEGDKVMKALRCCTWCQRQETLPKWPLDIVNTPQSQQTQNCTSEPEIYFYVFSHTFEVKLFFLLTMEWVLYELYVTLSGLA